MDKKEIEEFKKQSEGILAGIEKLQKEIQRYKTGAESFEVATEMFQDVTDGQAEVVAKLKEYIFGLYDIDTEKVIDKLKEVEGASEKATREMEMANRISGELLPMTNDLYSMTEDLQKSYAKMIERVEKISDRMEKMTDAYEIVAKELERRAEEEGVIKERLSEEKIWIDRLMKKMEKMDGVAQRIENAEKKINDKLSTLK